MPQQNGHLEHVDIKGLDPLSNDIEENSQEKSLYDCISDWIEKERNDRPLYTIDLAQVLRKVQLWEKKLPKFKPFYAVKTNSDPVLLRLLVSLGFSFDCASQGEIRMVMEAGGSPQNIIYAHVIKTPSSLEYASSLGVPLMTFDSENELLKIRKHYPEAKLLLRIAPEDVECSFDLSDKFGCPRGDAHRLLSTAKNLNLKVVGVSFHVGGLCKSPKSYKSTIEASRQVFDTAKELGFQFSVLDIGGGFIGAIGSEGLFHEVSQTVKETVAKNFPEGGLELIAEPGTFFIAAAVTLTTAICGKKEKYANSVESDAVLRYYYLNDSIYGSFFSGCHEYRINPRPLLSEAGASLRPLYKSRLWGATCCGDDCVMPSCQLPDMQEGEHLVWENVGAYNRAIYSTFCGALLPDVLYVFTRETQLEEKYFINSKVKDIITAECCFINDKTVPWTR